MKLVVCDDDPTLRGVVSKLASQAGFTVLAETDSATDAVDLVERFGAEVLVLDLALPWAGGASAIRELREHASPCQVVIFTAYSSDDPTLLDVRVRSVVEKPDFDRLEAVLREISSGAGPDGLMPIGGERRKPLPERPRFPMPGPLSPSGLEDPESFLTATEALEVGDAVLVTHVGGIDAPPHRHGRLLEADRLLVVARTLRAVLRVQDRLAVGSDDVELSALLLGSGRGGVTSVWHRLERAHELGVGAGVLSGGWAVFDGTESPTSTLARARDGAHRSMGRSPGDRLWAG